MLKKILLKIYKFILIFIIMIRNLFGILFDKVEDTTDDSSSTNRIEYREHINLLHIDPDSKLNNEKLKKVSKEISVVSKKIEELKNNHNLTIEEKRESIKKIKGKIDKIDKENISVIANNDIKKVFKEQNEIKISKEEKKLNEFIVSEKIDINENAIVNETKEDKVVKDNKKDKYVSYVIDTNKYLKETKDVFKEIEDDIKGNRKFDNNKYKVEDIKEKIKKIRSAYYEFKNSKYIYEIENDFNLKELDKFEIIKNSNSIDEYLKECNIILEKLEEYKKHDEVITKDEPVKQKSKEEKKRPKEEKKEEKPKLLEEIELASNIIEKDVLKNKNYINKIENSLSKIPTHERKMRRFNIFGNLLSNTINIGISLLPYKFIKNKKIGLLVSGFMLNNSIRTMRRVLVPTNVIEYNELSRIVKTELDIANNYERICNDSLYQVSMLKEEFIRYYGYINDIEVKKVYAKLENLENTISNELDKINGTKLNLNNKIKILKRR